MSIHVVIDGDEHCAICGKRIGRNDTMVFYFRPNKRAGAWHAKCGPLPHVEGLTVAARRTRPAKGE